MHRPYHINSSQLITAMKNIFQSNILGSSLRFGLCCLIGYAFSISSVYAQGEAESDDNPEIKHITRKDTGKKYPSRKVSGRITDSATGTPMGGVRVQVLGMERYSTLSEEDGTYELEVPNFMNTLYFYAPEYNPLQSVISKDNKINAQLLSTTFRSGYGEEIGITSRSVLKLDNTSSTTIEEEIMNKMAGDVNAVSRTGIPGQGAYMTIRGVNSLNCNAQPLVILDGNILDMQYDREALHEGYYNNVLNFIDPETVDDIQVLKNGTALYGAKGANGVIIITTKRGHSMATKIRARAYAGVELSPKRLDVLNGSQYTSYLSDIVSTVKDANKVQIGDLTCLDQSSRNIYRNVFNNNTDWQSGMYRSAITQNYNISVEGGDDVGMYSLSLGYNNSKSTLKGTQMDRLNLRFNTDIKISTKISTAFDAMYSNTSYDMFDNGWSEDYTDQNVGATNVLGLISAPFLSPYEYAWVGGQDGQFVLSPGVLAGKRAWDDNSGNNAVNDNPFNFPSKIHSDIRESLRNPYWILQNGEAYNKNRIDNTWMSLNFRPKWEINKSWTLQDRFSYTMTRNNEKYFLPKNGATPYKVDNRGYITSVIRNQFTSQSAITNDLRLDFKHQWGAHNLKAFVGWRYNIFSYSWSNETAYNNADDKVPSLSSSLDYYSSDGQKDSWKDITAYLQGEYNYANKYFAQFGISAMSSSRFGKNTNEGIKLFGVSWGIFPSLQLGWVISNEKWFNGVKHHVNFLKMTAGIEWNGNDDINPNATRTYWDSKKITDNMAAAVLKNIENSHLQWETVRKINWGLEGSFLNNRLQASIELFWNQTSNLLGLRDISDTYYYAGVTKYWTNSGTMTNKGYEVKLNGALINTKNWKWELGATLGHYNNKITELPTSSDNYIKLYTRDENGTITNKDNPTYVHGYSSSVYGDANVITAVGEAAGSFYGWQVNYNVNGTGVFASDEQASQAFKKADGTTRKLYYLNSYGNVCKFNAGDMAFVDQNGDGFIDESDKVVIGNPNPDIYGNIFTSLTFKRLRLDLNFKYSLGNDIYNYQRSVLEGCNTTYNQTTAVLRRWSYDGQITDVPRACYITNNNYANNERMSSRWIEDGSYLKLKNIRLTYNIPLRNEFIQGLNVWGEANNVFCITKYLGTDPEVSAANSTIYQGIDAGRLGQGRNFKFGVTLDI